MKTRRGYPIFTKTIISILSIALLTAVASEIKIMPFENAPFRFGLGSIIFFLAVLIRPVPIVWTGFVTGFTVVLFRVLLNQITNSGSIFQNFLEHLPAAFFYIVYALCLHVLKVEKYKMKLFRLGLFATFFETISNGIEQLLTILFVTRTPILYEEWFLLIIVAFARSFFVVGLYSAIAISEQKKQVQQLLNIGSNLYVETLYIQKAMNQIEKITASSFDLYKQLKTSDSDLSLKALLIAQEIHEVKKDGERIYAGLSKIVTAERKNALLISTLLQYITESNEKYSEMMNKNIQFQISYNQDFYTHQHVTLLALINNLVANAVEAILKEGTINILIFTTKEKTVITVEDDGVGIHQTLLSVIFDPGYTSKFNSEGNPSTGIGLSHVSTIVTRLEGKITVVSDSTTNFTVTIPTYKLQ